MPLQNIFFPAPIGLPAIWTAPQASCRYVPCAGVPYVDSGLAAGRSPGRFCRRPFVAAPVSHAQSRGGLLRGFML